MIPAGPFYIDDLLTFTANTHAAATGAATDADSVPAYRVYEDETGTAILTGSMAKLDDGNTVGFYSEQITLSAANGFEVGKSYSVYVSAAVSSVTGTVSGGFKVIAAPTTPPTAAAIADAVWDEDATGHQTGGTFGQAIGDPAADTGTIYARVADILVDTGTTLQGELDGIQADTEDLQAKIGTPAGASVSADIAAIKAETASILADTGTDGVVVAAASKTGYALSAAGVDGVWDEVVDGSITGRQAMRLLTASQGGKISGADGSTVTIRDPADTTDRVVATVDATGRTAVTLNLA